MATRIVIVVGCLFGLAIIARATDKDAKADDALTKLLKERAKLADDSYQACSVGYEAGTIILDTVLAASNELTDAKLALCDTKAQRIAVLKDQVKRLKDWEAKIKALNSVMAKGGEDDKLARTGVQRVKAEIALELEKRDTPPAAPIRPR